VLGLISWENSLAAASNRLAKLGTFYQNQLDVCNRQILSGNAPTIRVENFAGFSGFERVGS
jgi:hypothetical protein